MGIVEPAPPADAPAGRVMNCGIVAPPPTSDDGAARMGNLVADVEIIWGASTVPPVGRDVGMYVMGSTAGHDCVPVAINCMLAAAAF